jgi:hypothetical protein
LDERHCDERARLAMTGDERPDVDVGERTPDDQEVVIVAVCQSPSACRGPPADPSSGCSHELPDAHAEVAAVADECGIEAGR